MRTKVLLALLAVTAMASLLLFGPAGLPPAPQSAEAAFLNEVKKLLASDAEAGDNFGASAAVSGDTAVVGAWLESAEGFRAGAAYVFQRSEGGTGNWGQVQKLTASDAQAENFFGRSVAVSGDTAVVGAFAANAAYVFERNEGGADNWGEVQKLTASDAGDAFGSSVAVGGDTAIVGSSYVAAYVFERNEGGADNWGEVTKLMAADAEAGDSFGGSVAVSGETAVVGAAGAYGEFNRGAAYVFQRNEGGADNWGEVQKLIASNAGDQDNFGLSVAVSGDTAVVGSFREDAGGWDDGAAYVFQRNEGGPDNWGEVRKLLASDAEDFDNFGVSVAVSGDTAVVGAHQEGAIDICCIFAGAAYVFQRNQGGANNWGEVTKINASDAQTNDYFGGSVAVSGNTAVVGAWQEDAEGSNAGAGYVFDLLQPKPAVTYRELAEHWAPVIYQDTDSSCAIADYITRFDYDGVGSDFKGLNNWNNLTNDCQTALNSLNANVYYWVVETSTNWFVGYAFFHPRDWTDDIPGQHENDMEGVLLTIKRDGSQFGQFLVMNTQGHGNFESYRDTGAAPSQNVTIKNEITLKNDGFSCDTRQPPVIGDCLDVGFEGGHPNVYVRAEGHAVTGGEGWELASIGFPGDDGVVYRYDALGPTVPANGEALFQLLSIQELWSRSCDFGDDDPFAEFGRFAGNEGGSNKASPPWGWSDFFGEAPQFFRDPAKGIGEKFNGLGAFSTSYLGASFSPGPNEDPPDCSPQVVAGDQSVRYENLSGSGQTTITTSQSGSALPPGFETGNPPLYIDVSSTSIFSGATVCTLYDETAYSLERSIRLMHDEVGGLVAAPSFLDPEQDRVCAEVTSFSEFAVAQLIPDGDYDEDGCTNAQELNEVDPDGAGPNGPQHVGGLRDPLNPWDFYDVAGGDGGPPDGIIDLPNDILGVILNYTGNDGYNPGDPAAFSYPGTRENYDRGTSFGPNPWNMTAPDGVIDLPNDVLGVILQYGHDCR